MMLCPDCGGVQKSRHFCRGCGDSFLAMGLGVFAVPALVLAIGWLPAALRDLRANHPAAPSGDSARAGLTRATVMETGGLPAQGAGGVSYGAGRKPDTAADHHPARPTSKKRGR